MMTSIHKEKIDSKIDVVKSTVPLRPLFWCYDPLAQT